MPEAVGRNQAAGLRTRQLQVIQYDQQQHQQQHQQPPYSSRLQLQVSSQQQRTEQREQQGESWEQEMSTQSLVQRKGVSINLFKEITGSKLQSNLVIIVCENVKK